MAQQVRTNRFVDESRGVDVLSGFQDASRDPINKQFLLRQLKPYRKFGVPQQLNKLEGMTDTQLERMAAKAILKRRKVQVRKLPTKINRKQHSAREIAAAKRVMSRPNPTRQALRRTADTRRHIKSIRANRRVMRTRLWSGKGYDAYKGYI